MYKTESEIFSQHEALLKTYDYMMGQKKELEQFFKANSFDSLTFIGCGSSYSLCKSAAASSRLRLKTRVNAIPAGDLMMNFPFYEKSLENTLIIAPSRSGSTSEVVNAVNKAKEALGAKCISISMVSGSRLGEFSDVSLEMPWAFDESVCQTRTVTNLYLADLLLIAFLAGDCRLVDELKAVVDNEGRFIQENAQGLKDISSRDWKKVLVLADAELEGIAEEGALAFNEICMLPSNYYHILDVRHGPMVLVNSETLVIMAATPYGREYQTDLVKDLKARGAYIISATTTDEGVAGADCSVALPSGSNYAVSGVPFIFIAQALAFYKALARGTNPDEPQGLDAWIKL